MFKAVQFSDYGDPDVLEVGDVEVLRPGPGQVLVKVRFAGLNPIDAKVRGGAMWPVAFPNTPGLEATGTVEAVGADVSGHAVGDAVFGRTATGSYAEYALAAADEVTAKPADLLCPTAAGLTVAAESAYRALDAVAAEAGETVLIHGASGAVGVLAVQFALARGANVVGTGAPENHAYLREVGAEPVEYGAGLADRVRGAASAGVDAAIDLAGHGALGALVESVGGPARVIALADPAEAAQHGVRFSSGAPGEDRMRPAVDLALRLHAEGTLRLAVAAVFPLADAAEAHRLAEKGHAPGKIVLSTE